MNSFRNQLILQAAFGIVVAFLIAGSPNRVQSQDQDPSPSQCSVDRKNQYYKDFQASYDGDSKDQGKALEAAKKYLACPDYSKDQEETVAKLNLAVGLMLSLKQSYIEAVPHFIKAASYNSTIKTSPRYMPISPRPTSRDITKNWRKLMRGFQARMGPLRICSSWRTSSR